MLKSKAGWTRERHQRFLTVSTPSGGRGHARARGHVRNVAEGAQLMAFRGEKHQLPLASGLQRMEFPQQRHWMDGRRAQQLPTAGEGCRAYVALPTWAVPLEAAGRGLGAAWACLCRAVVTVPLLSHPPQEGRNVSLPHWEAPVTPVHEGIMSVGLCFAEVFAGKD